MRNIQMQAAKVSRGETVMALWLASMRLYSLAAQMIRSGVVFEDELTALYDKATVYSQTSYWCEHSDECYNAFVTIGINMVFATRNERKANNRLIRQSAATNQLQLALL